MIDPLQVLFCNDRINDLYEDRFDEKIEALLNFPKFNLIFTRSFNESFLTASDNLF